MFSKPYPFTKVLNEARDFIKAGLNVEEVVHLTNLSSRIVKELFHDSHTPERSIAENSVELLALQGHLPKTISRITGITVKEADDLTAPLRVYYRNNIKHSIASYEEAKSLFEKGYDLIEVLLQTSCDEEIIKSLYYKEFLNKHYNKEVQNE